METTNYEQYKQKDGYFYYTYKIVLTEGSLKGHYYYGQHRTKNINDNYKGSGAIIRSYYKKYPNSYIKEILQFFNNLDELNVAEEILIGTLYDDDPMCLNRCSGGRNSIPSMAVRQLWSAHRKGRVAWFKGKHHTEESKRKMSESKKGQIPWNLGITHSEQTCQKIREKALGHIITQDTREKMSKSQKNNDFICQPILQYSIDGKFIKEYRSITEAAQQTNIYDKNISANATWRTKTAGGFIWIYKDINTLQYYINKSKCNIIWDFKNWGLYDDLIYNNKFSKNPKGQRKVDVYYKGIYQQTFNSIKECSEYYSYLCCSKTIYNILNNKKVSSLYDDYKFCYNDN